METINFYWKPITEIPTKQYVVEKKMVYLFLDILTIVLLQNPGWFVLLQQNQEYMKLQNGQILKSNCYGT